MHSHPDIITLLFSLTLTLSFSPHHNIPSQTLTPTRLSSLFIYFLFPQIHVQSQHLPTLVITQHTLTTHTLTQSPHYLNTHSSHTLLPPPPSRTLTPHILESHTLPLMTHPQSLFFSTHFLSQHAHPPSTPSLRTISLSQHNQHYTHLSKHI